MRDFDIRIHLRNYLLNKYYLDSHSKVVEELNLPAAKARIDMAVINGHLHGYEIKSSKDTLQRLPSQLEAYEKIFDYLSVITEKKHSKKLIDLVPSWVNVYVCSEVNDQFVIELAQKGSINKNKSGFHLAKILWREELIQILNEKQIPFIQRDRNWILAEIVSSNIKVKELSEIVRIKLKGRKNWKGDIKECYEET